jgi:hypothetical protein
MGVFRFSNAVSDIKKFVGTYKIIYSELKDETDFNHDDARDALIKHGLVSSSGAIGLEAVNRSVRKDRSFDPLYNQLKMYSEIYRMLGWYKPSRNRGNFKFTEISEYIYEADEHLIRKIFELSTLNIVSPNPLVEVKSGNVLRPFLMILNLMEKSEGLLTRDEIIITVLNCQSDLTDDYLTVAVEKIKYLRKDFNNVTKELELIMSHNKIARSTLENYTRFPLGALIYNNWAKPERTTKIYKNREVNAYILTDYGYSYAANLKNMVNFRNENLIGFTLEMRASFSLLMFYKNLETLDYIIDIETNVLMSELEITCNPVLDKFQIKNLNKIIYSPVQQSTDEEMDFAH